MNDFSAYPNISDNTGDGRSYDGLTRRELFAAMAMQGFCANPGYIGAASNIPGDAEAMADGMIAKLDKADPSHSADQWTDIEEAGERWTAACLSTSFPYEHNRISDETEPNK
jgi:hypothetical protein